MVTYFDPTAGVTPQALDKVEKRRMDCIDCHNASGHPFPNPANLVDQAINEGKISRSLPSVKARATAIIEKAAAITGGQAERGAKFDQLIAASAPKDLKPELTKAEKAFAGRDETYPAAHVVLGRAASTGAPFPTTSATTISPAAFAATTASISTKMARRSGCSARYATHCRRSYATTVRAAWFPP